MDIKDTLEKRRLLKRKKPTFLAQDSHKKVRVKNKWKKPKGSDSKMRVSRKGYRRSVRIGWGSPGSVKGLTRDGFKLVYVATIEDLKKVDPKTDAVLIYASVGLKKRLTILTEAIKLKITIKNYKDPQKYLEEATNKLEEKKKKRDDSKKVRDSKRKEREKESEKKRKEQEKSETKEKSEAKSADKSVEKVKDKEKKDQEKILMTKN